jgi:hypothetical protein
MEKLTKNCKVHGDLEEKYIKKRECKTSKSGFRLDCIKCKMEAAWKATVCKIHGKLEKENIKANGRCKICHRVSANRKRDNNREWFNAKMAKDRENNPEKWEKIHKQSYKRKVEKFGREALTTKEITRRRNMTVENYEKMLIEQKEVCKICGNKETRKCGKTKKVLRLVLDHCHLTDKVRGLLCHKCNIILGYAEDDINILHSAIIYLEENA